MKRPWRTGIGLLSLAAIVVGGGSYLTARHFAHLEIDGRPPDRPRKNAPFITSPDAVVEAMVTLAEVRDTDLVYDLGCGDGRIVITAAVMSGCRGVGYDIDPARVAESRANAAEHSVADRVSFEERDIFTLDLSEASVVMMYLLPRQQKDLIPQFQQMKPGSRIVSHDFGLGELRDMPPDRTVEVQLGEGDKHYVHLWTTPLRVAAAANAPAVSGAPTADRE